MNYIINKGKSGENQAATFLQNRGHVILEKNFRIREGEIDIISSEGNSIFFIEVKNWSSAIVTNPLEIFTKSKRDKMRMVAEVYLSNNESFILHSVSFGLIFIKDEHNLEFYTDLF